MPLSSVRQSPKRGLRAVWDGIPHLMGKGLLLSFLLYSYIQQRPLCSSCVYLVPASEHSSEPPLLRSLQPPPRKCSLGAVLRGVLPGCMSFPELQKSHSLKTQTHLLLTDVLTSCLVNLFTYSGISTAHRTVMPQS